MTQSTKEAQSGRVKVATKNLVGTALIIEKSTPQNLESNAYGL